MTAVFMAFFRALGEGQRPIGTARHDPPRVGGTLWYQDVVMLASAR